MKKLLILAACCLTLPAHAEFKDGNRLYSEMTGSTNQQMNAIGYIAGVTDALSGVAVCAPASVTAGQLFDMVKQYLEDQPQVRHFTADALIYRVLTKVWPCKKGSGV